MLFEWYWFPLFIILLRHIFWATFTIYYHRGIAHRSIEFSNGFSKSARFILWLNEFWWPGWNREAWWQHQYHHLHPDSEQDPHDPRRIPFKDFVHGPAEIGPGTAYYVPQSYRDSNTNPHPELNDGLEDFFKRTQSKPIQRYIVGAVAAVLFGIIPGIATVVLWWLVCKFWHQHIAIAVTHGVGTLKWMDYQSPLATDKLNRLAVNWMPIGLLYAGEEFHSNHHCRPGSANYSQRWWELDFGYIYACIFERLGLLRIRQR